MCGCQTQREHQSVFDCLPAVKRERSILLLKLKQYEPDTVKARIAQLEELQRQAAPEITQAMNLLGNSIIQNGLTYPEDSIPGHILKDGDECL